MAGYISLFFDDARMQLSQNKLAEVKDSIFINYQKAFPPPNPIEKEDLQSFIENGFLKEIETHLRKGNRLGEAKKANLARYWDLNIGTAIGIVKKDAALIDKIQETLQYITSCQNILSEAINAGKGIISKNMVEDMEKRKQSLEKIRTDVATVTSNDSFKGAFFNSLIGTIANAQGLIHEVAGVIAADEAKKVAEGELKKINEDFQLIIESTGGKLVEHSDLESAAKKTNLDLGLTNNAKNDLTVAVKDGNGKIVWSTGLSLKSTSAASPSEVKIMQQDLTTLLNKVCSEEHYLNAAAALGKGDWSHRRAGIGGIAENSNVVTSSKELTDAWKNMVYSAIYSQIINMFAGSGGVLNNAQYLIINSRVIPMREIFEKLQAYQTQIKSSDFTLPGIKISGAGPATKSRTEFINANIDGFIKDSDGNPFTTAEERILRSTSAWKDVYSKLQTYKIKISLKYRDLFGTTPTK